jgi:ribosomal protein S18 acetylase RimI-like enzyme
MSAYRGAPAPSSTDCPVDATLKPDGYQLHLVSLTARPATRPDIPAIRRVAERAWRAAHEPIVGSATVDAFLVEFYDTDSFRKRVAREDRHLRVAVDAGSGEGSGGIDAGAGDDVVAGSDAAGEDEAPADADATDRGVVGYTLSLPDDDDPAVFHLAHVYVPPDRWGEGVGRRLLADVETLAHEQGADRLRLGVLADNDRAVAFYERAGFERVDTGHDDRLDAPNHTYEKPLE